MLRKKKKRSLQDPIGLWSYDFATNTWSQHNRDNFANYTSTMDTKRGLLVVVGGGEIFAYDLRNPAAPRQTWATKGGEGLLGRSGAGFDDDPAIDRFVGWAGGPVFQLDPETRTWTTDNAPGAPEGNRNGIYGRGATSRA